MSTPALPEKYRWLSKEPGPRLLLEALKDFGTLETPGTPDNPKIIAWADEVAAAVGSKYADWAADFYNDDATPWCGLAMAVWAVRSAQGRPERFPPNNYLSALAWAAFGAPVAKAEGMLGDVLVFVRKGGGHVATYAGEDATHFHILGGNQGDAVSIVRKLKGELYAVRRPIYLSRPTNIRKVHLSAAGTPASVKED